MVSLVVDKMASEWAFGSAEKMVNKLFAKLALQLVYKAVDEMVIKLVSLMVALKAFH